MNYRYCGKSGLQLPEISLGLWHNFGDIDSLANARDIIWHAFDNGVTHFDLANNYGPPPGSAEENFGRILQQGLHTHRDEIIISTKAGHDMWQGPYGTGSSRKHLMASIDQSLKRMGLEYVDIFYSHRYCADTPIEETVQALADIVKQGKALYVGLSKYPADQLAMACSLLRERGVRCLIYQHRYSLLCREPETSHFPLVRDLGLGFIAFSPLAQGLLTNRYLYGIPDDSRAAKPSGFLHRAEVTPEVVEKVRRLGELAQRRGQSIAQMALAWVLSHHTVTSVIVGASSVNQLVDNLQAIDNVSFTQQELDDIQCLNL